MIEPIHPRPGQIPSIPKTQPPTIPPENAEDDVYENAVTSTLHHLASQPTRDETHNDPGQKSHGTSSLAPRGSR